MAKGDGCEYLGSPRRYTRRTDTPLTLYTGPKASSRMSTRIQHGRLSCQLCRQVPVFEGLMSPSHFNCSPSYFEMAVATHRIEPQGYNAAIIAYGQTGTGKTYTMDGAQEGPGQGIIPRAIEDIFQYIENDSAAHSKFLVRASYLQIYNEVTACRAPTLHTAMDVQLQDAAS